MMLSKNETRKRRKVRIRKKISGTAERPRLVVYRSNLHIYAQVVDDATGATLAATSMAIVYAIFMPMRAFDITNITGVLRAGGDARTASIIDITPLWLVAIPLMAVTALVFNAPVPLVCIAMQAENLCKCPLGLIRFHSRKWIHDITRIEP